MATHVNDLFGKQLIMQIKCKYIYFNINALIKIRVNELHHIFISWNQNKYNRGLSIP